MANKRAVEGKYVKINYEPEPDESGEEEKADIEDTQTDPILPPMC